jgi:curli biogenesis system outer membrane secretion channel CsgG
MLRKLVLSAALAALALSAQSRRSVAIEEFDYSTVMTESQAIFGTQANIGKGISALLTKRIAQDGKFTVVERQKVNTLIKEQDFGASGRVKKGTQARIGQIRGADYTLMGDIVTFGRDDKRKGAAGGGFGGGGGGFGGIRRNEFKAVVMLNFRLVDNESSEVIMTGEARGESKRNATAAGGGFWTGGMAAGGVVDFGSSNFAETIIGEATIDAVNKISEQISAQSSSASGAKQIEIEAKVASVDGSMVIIAAGSEAGVQVGDKFEISRIVKEVKDPTTKEVLDVVTAPVGSLTIATVKPKIAYGTFTGAQPAKEGDMAVKK